MKVKLLLINPVLAMEIAYGQRSILYLKQDTDYRGRVAIASKVSGGGDGTIPGMIICLADLVDVNEVNGRFFYKLENIDIIEPIKLDDFTSNVIVDISPNIMPDFNDDDLQEEWEKEHFWTFIRGARKHYDDSWFIPYPSSFS